MNLPEDAKKALDALNGGGFASCAVRIAAEFEGIIMAISGMSDTEQIANYAACIKDFRSFSEDERKALKQVVEIFKSRSLIACTGCRYCADACPMNIDIPNLLACLNAKKLYDGNITDYYKTVHTVGCGMASQCIGCGECEKLCPQFLEIRQLLREVAAEFEQE